MPRKQVTTTRNASEVDAATYNHVVNRTNLRSIRLLESRFEIKPEALEVDPSEWRKAVEFELGEVIITETGGLYAVLHFQIICRHGRKRVLHASCRYLAHYKVDGEFSREDGETFMERVARVAVYPYFRSLIASLVAEAGLQMPPLPILSLQPRTLGSAAALVEPVADKESNGKKRLT